MNLFKWVDKGVKKLNWYDVSLIKATTFFFTLFLITVWESFRTIVLSLHWYVYLILGLICAVLPMMKFFK